MDSWRRIFFTLLGLYVLVIGISIAEASSYLNLTVECVKQNQDGSYTADLGYANLYRDDGYLIVVSSVPDDNFFSTGEPNRGQPTTFQYGRFPGQFKVTWDGTPLTWTVRYRVRGSEYVAEVTIDAENQSQRACKVVTYADCIMRDYGRYENSNWYESFDTYFSYYNPGEEFSLSSEQSNRVTHNPWCSGEGCESELSTEQPSTFMSGHHRGVFHADSRENEQYGNTNDIYWVISGGGDESEDQSIVARGEWSYTRECLVTPTSECLQKGCQVEGQKGTKTAWFGYKNSEPFTVYSRSRNYYNSLRQAYGCEYNNYSGYDQFGRPCIYPQPETFESGNHTKVFGVCFSGDYNSGQEGGSGEDLPIDEVGLNNHGYVRWQLGSGWYDYSNSHYATITSESKQCNRAPVCTTGNYALPCAGVSTNVFLQGLLSNDPDGDTLKYDWQHTCKGATLFGADSLNPVLGMFTPGDCTVTLKVSEQGTKDGFSASCSGTVSVSACAEVKDTKCQDRDMTPTEVLLATAADEQLKLIGRQVSFLRKNAPHRSLAQILRAANSYGRKNRALSFTFPNTIVQCSTTANCSSQSMTGIVDQYSKNASQLDAIAKRLAGRVRNADSQKVAAIFDKRRLQILDSLKTLYQGIPASTNNCS